MITSKNGDIRTYNKVGGIAKNYIPSYTQSNALDMDSDRTGNLLLVTYKNDL